jgi:chemotaxis protein MotB
MSAHPEIVIIRRRSVHEDAAHHGGAWKIAFADFMTAMMAFFLVLWIISATDKNTKTLIARYFNPVRVEEPAKAQKGIHGAPEQDTDAPGTEAGAPNALKPRSDQGETASGSVRESSTSPVTEAKGKHLAKQDPKTPPDPSKPNPTMTEEELFSDPRASLDKIAGLPPPGPRVDPSATLKGYGEVGPSADEALRDPFRPLGSDMAINVVTPDSGAQLPVGPTVEEPNQPIEASHPVPPETLQQHPVKKESNPPSDVAPEQTKAEVAQAPQTRAADPARAQAVAAAALLADVKARVGPEGQSLAGPELDVQATDEGILISLTDRDNYSMFAIGSAEPQPRVVRMMDAIAMSLETMPGAIVVRGHTDARPYRTKTYDNWRLSSARAQMAYYMLDRAGLAEKRFERIEGFADHRLKDPGRPLAAENRRIEILLREAKP